MHGLEHLTAVLYGKRLVSSTWLRQSSAATSRPDDCIAFASARFRRLTLYMSNPCGVDLLHMLIRTYVQLLCQACDRLRVVVMPVFALRSPSFEAEQPEISLALKKIARKSAKQVLAIGGEAGKHIHVEAGARPEKPSKPMSTFSLLTMREYQKLSGKEQKTSLHLQALFDQLTVALGPPRAGL